MGAHRRLSEQAPAGALKRRFTFVVVALLACGGEEKTTPDSVASRAFDAPAVSNAAPDSTVRLSNCTASFVSPNGLILTNFHCSWTCLEDHSTKDKSLLDKLNPGDKVQFTVEQSGKDYVVTSIK